MKFILQNMVGVAGLILSTLGGWYLLKSIYTQDKGDVINRQATLAGVDNTDLSGNNLRNWKNTKVGFILMVMGFITQLVSLVYGEPIYLYEVSVASILITIIAYVLSSFIIIEIVNRLTRK